MQGGVVVVVVVVDGRGGFAFVAMMYTHYTFIAFHWVATTSH
jgi:hypothetical protein